MFILEKEPLLLCFKKFITRINSEITHLTKENWNEEKITYEFMTSLDKSRIYYDTLLKCLDDGYSKVDQKFSIDFEIREENRAREGTTGFDLGIGIIFELLHTTECWSVLVQCKREFPERMFSSLKSWNQAKSMLKITNESYYWLYHREDEIGIQTIPALNAKNLSIPLKCEFSQNFVSFTDFMMSLLKGQIGDRDPFTFKIATGITPKCWTKSTEMQARNKFLYSLINKDDNSLLNIPKISWIFHISDNNVNRNLLNVYHENEY